MSGFDLRPGAVNWVDGDFTPIGTDGAVVFRPTPWHRRAIRFAQAIACRFGLHSWADYEVEETIYETEILLCSAGRAWKQCAHCGKVVD